MCKRLIIELKIIIVDVIVRRYKTLVVRCHLNIGIFIFSFLIITCFLNYLTARSSIIISLLLLYPYPFLCINLHLPPKYFTKFQLPPNFLYHIFDKLRLYAHTKNYNSSCASLTIIRFWCPRVAVNKAVMFNFL